jgi:hypothetical protein
MARFPSAAHLASWAGLCPGNHESASKRPSGRARKSDTALLTAMVEAAWAAPCTRSTYLGAQYQRFRRRFGSRGEIKAIFAVAHTMPVIAWHILAEEKPYAELGVDYFTRRSDPEAHAPMPRPRNSRVRDSGAAPGQPLRQAHRRHHCRGPGPARPSRTTASHNQ